MPVSVTTSKLLIPTRQDVYVTLLNHETKLIDKTHLALVKCDNSYVCGHRIPGFQFNDVPNNQFSGLNFSFRATQDRHRLENNTEVANICLSFHSISLCVYFWQSNILYLRKKYYLVGKSFIKVNLLWDDEHQSLDHVLLTAVWPSLA